MSQHVLRIRRIEPIAVALPLPRAVSDGIRLHTRRDHLIVKVYTEEGLVGTGFTLAYDGSRAMARLVEELFAPKLKGRSALETELLWDEMYRLSIQTGRRGLVMRTISAIDIALWDLRGKALGVPVMNLLGIYSEKLRCYVTGGYYREGQTIDQLVREVAVYLEKGFNAIKIKVGRLSPEQDAARIRAVRKTVGDDVDLLLDANGAWNYPTQALDAIQRLAEYSPLWIEEPLRADNIESLAEVTARSPVPVATGELESTRWGFAQLMNQRAAHILQPDATVVGGVSEWLKVAHAAASRDIPIAPHYHWDIHTQLLATIPNGLFVEYFMREASVKVFDDLIENPLVPEKGWLRPRQEPGFGIHFREEKIREYQLSL